MPGLKISGIDINAFTAHSIRSASTPAEADSGITTSDRDIPKAADWSIESVFRKFYYWPTRDALYGCTVLSSTVPSSET